MTFGTFEFDSSHPNEDVPMLNYLAIAAVVSATMIGASGAFSQEAVPSRSNPKPGQGGFSLMTTSAPTVILLKTSEVQTELKLEQGRAKKIDTIDAEADRERTRLLAVFNANVNELHKKSDRNALGLSQERRAEIRKIMRDYFKAGPPTRSVSEGNGKSRAENREKVLAVLTSEQKAKCHEMTGEPFKFPTPQWSPPRGTSTRSSEPAKPCAEKKDQ